MKVIGRAFLASVATLALTTAAPAAAISAPSRAASLTLTQTAPAAPSGSSAVVRSNVVYVDCVDFLPGEPCYLSYFQNHGVSTVTFFATNGSVTHTADCGGAHLACEEKWVGYPNLGTAVAFVIQGPNINHARTTH
jgi:hypothetical protein